MRPTEPFRVRLAQVSVRLGDIAANMRLHEEVAFRAAADGVDLLIFPELSLTGYYLRDLTPEVALPLDSPELAVFARLSGSMSLVVGMVEESDQYSFHASALYYEQGQLIHCHRKVYLPTYGMFDEGRYLSEGRQVRAFNTRFGRMGLLVCEDAWHPALPTILAQEGMHYLIVTANSPARGVGPDGLQIEHVYDALLATYARLFQCYVLFCNRVGCEDGVSFWGGSRVIDPSGATVACAPRLEEAEVDAVVRPLEVRRARLMAPLVEDERLDLILRELQRVAHERA